MVCYLWLHYLETLITEKFVVSQYTFDYNLPFSRSGRAARINARSAATSWKRWRNISEP